MIPIGTTYVTQQEFDELLEYSSTVPTGTTIGKKWKRHEPYRRPQSCIDPEHDCGHWFMGEYIRPGPKEFAREVWIRWTKLVIGEPPKKFLASTPTWCPEED